MSAKHAYEKIASDYCLWCEYVGAAMTEVEFDSLTAEQKVTLQVEAFGPETVEGRSAPQTSLASDAIRK